MNRAVFASSALLALLIGGAGALAAPADPAPAAADPAAACRTADPARYKADLSKIVADCGKALEGATAADAQTRARLLVARAEAQWRDDHNDAATPDVEAALKLAPDDPDALLLRAALRIEANDADGALADIATVLKAQPHNVVALLYRGRAKQWLQHDKAGAKADYDAALAIDPKATRVLAQRAALMMGDDPAAAERDIQAAVALAPDDPRMRLRLAPVYETQGRNKEAFALYDALIKAYPADIMPIVYRSDLKRQLKDGAGALKDADQALRIEPDDALAHYTRGKALALLGRDQESMAAYRQAVKLEPDDVDYLIAVGFMSRKAGALDEGLAALDKALKRDPKNDQALFDRALIWEVKKEDAKAIKDYDAVIALAPDSSAYSNRAALHASAGDHKAALADYEKAIELNGKDPDLHIARGIELGELKRGDEELKAYDDALKLDPHAVSAKVNKGIVYAGRQEWRLAIEAYQAALQDSPKRADLIEAIGECLNELGQKDEARKQYDRALRMDPKMVAAWSARAALNRDSMRYREALADYGQAIALAPDDSDLRVYRAQVLRLDNKVDAALADLDKAVALDPKSIFALNGRGLANTEAEHYDAALADFDQAIALDPDYEAAYYNRADVFIDLDREDRAIRDLNMSLKLSPNDALTLARKGRAYKIMKDYKRALEELDAALRVDPTYSDALYWRAEVKESLGDTAGAAADRKAAEQADAA
jgi:tetratricopeptide (TPR) repeat protein